MKKVEVHYPPQFANLPDEEPAIFLAGPIQGAPDWQEKAVKTFRKIDLPWPLHVFTPRVPRVSSSQEISHSYERQVMWEKRHLEKARDIGAVLFWFAAKDDSLPYPEGRAYAQTSRIELGRVFGWRDLMATTIAMGIEPGYQGSVNYIKSMADEYGIHIYDDLASLCRASVHFMIGRS
ncbi:MAG TPA: nucleoside 2-deoxyribosyltransferase domain-containing protein [Nitrososphaera sp.]|nr:nucleoside 2-deoxyribosyltransferase domain-containing protein [Nitrososphaera sp.]